MQFWQARATAEKHKEIRTSGDACSSAKSPQGAYITEFVPTSRNTIMLHRSPQTQRARAQHQGRGTWTYFGPRTLLRSKSRVVGVARSSHSSSQNTISEVDDGLVQHNTVPRAATR